jgi:hypothetical protein
VAGVVVVVVVVVPAGCSGAAGVVVVVVDDAGAAGVVAACGCGIGGIASIAGACVSGADGAVIGVSDGWFEAVSFGLQAATARTAAPMIKRVLKRIFISV